MPRLISGEEMVRAMGLFWVSQHCSECCTHFPRPLLDVLANCMLPIIACNDILSPMDGVEKAPSTTTRCTMKRPTAAVPASTSHESPNWFLLRNSKWKYAFSMQKKHNSLKYGSFCFFLVVLGKDWLTSSSLGHWTKQPKRNGRCWWRNNCTSW